MKPININVGTLRNSSRQQADIVTILPSTPIDNKIIEKTEKILLNISVFIIKIN